MPFAQVKELPESIQDALRFIEYHGKDIQFKVQDTFYMQGAYGDGYRAFLIILNLETCEYKIHYGAWGGSNMFSQNVVDDYREPVAIPNNCVIIQGQRGAKIFAELLFNPSNVLPQLNSANELSELEVKFLAVFRMYKPIGRKPYIQGRETLIQSLVDRGYLSKNKVGLSITTKGKNACEHVRYVPEHYDMFPAEQ